MDIQKEVIAFFDSKGNLSEKSKNEIINTNYLEIGLIDSMELVEMIVLFEDKFKIKFSTEDLQSDEFRTIGGIINMITRFNQNKN